MLGPDDPLPHRPRRVVVAGASGSGKTTLAARLGERLDLPHVEIDGLYHGPGWRKRETFLADVEGFVTTDSWVTEWQYDSVRALLASRADLLVWLDFPRATVMRQVVRRTVVRRIRRQRLWNGNVEPPLHTVLTDPQHIVRWAWNTQPSYVARVAEVRAAHPDLPVVRLTRRAEVTRWLIGPASSSPRWEPPAGR